MFKVVGGLLRLRYIVLGSAISGGVGLSRKYDEFKQGLPEIPDFFKDLFDFKKLETFDIDSWTASLSQMSKSQLDTFNQWLEEAKTAIQNQNQQSK